MPTQKISRSTMDRLKPGSVPIYSYDALLPGFGVRVSPKGKIKMTFIVQGYGGGKSQRRTLGRYPIQSLDEARAAAQLYLKALTDTGTPLVRLRMADALDAWLREHGPKLKPRTLSDYQIISSRIVRPVLGDKADDRVTRADVVELHHARAPTPRRANYVVAVLRAFFTWAEDAGYRPPGSNPARRIAHYPENRRERFLSESEITRAATAINAAELAGQISLYAAAALRLTMLTGARRGEMEGLRPGPETIGSCVQPAAVRPLKQPSQSVSTCAPRLRMPVASPSMCFFENRFTRRIFTRMGLAAGAGVVSTATTMGVLPGLRRAEGAHPHDARACRRCARRRGRPS